MAHTTAGSLAGNVKFACSFCGVPRFYPDEMVYTAEKTFRCNWHGSETTTNLEEAQKHGRGIRATGDAPRFPVGVTAAWQLVMGDDMPTAAGLVNGTTGAATSYTGTITAARSSTGVYVITVPASLARTNILIFATAASTIPLMVTKEVIDSQSVRLYVINRVGTSTDANLDVALWTF